MGIIDIRNCGATSLDAESLMAYWAEGLHNKTFILRRKQQICLPIRATAFMWYFGFFSHLLTVSAGISGAFD